ncbi:hypothetical protein CEXT_205761 [Caerostris extrusa]|uniref:Uncharacterized protein n=1 Tax=Caerostris extrusa TaxID=172846 RepID=A0AAV4S8L8_CAEEX|nr:hypothetical protein CEXT_205761 [Caerostris extrusa]
MDVKGEEGWWKATGAQGKKKKKKKKRNTGAVRTKRSKGIRTEARGCRWWGGAERQIPSVHYLKHGGKKLMGAQSAPNATDQAFKRQMPFLIYSSFPFPPPPKIAPVEEKVTFLSHEI